LAIPEPNVPAGTLESPSRSRTLNVALLACLLLAVGLAVFAYRDLARLASGANPQAFPDVRGVERFFFVPSAPSYGLVGSIFLWMLVNRVRRLRASLLEPGSALGAAALLAPSAALGIWAYWTATPSLLVPSLMLLLLGSGWVLGGPRAAGVLLRPALLLLFAWPWPGVLFNQIVWGLQMLAVDLATAILTVMRIPHAVVGDQILARSHTFQVIETCSGMRSMETLTVASLAYCELFGRHGRRLWALVLAAPVIALLLNGVRVVTIILNPYSEIVAVHTIQGLVVIVLGVLALAALDSGLDRLGWLREGASRVIRIPRDAPFHARRWAVVGGLLAALALATTLPSPFAPAGAPFVPLMQRIPAAVGDWVGKPAKVDGGFLGTVYYTQMLRRDYQLGSDEITIFAAEDDRQQPAASLISPKVAVGESGWEPIARSRVAFDGWEAERLVLRGRSGRNQLVYFWTNGALSTPAELARAALALDRGPGRRAEPMRAMRLAIAFDSGNPDGERAAEAQLQEFVRGLLSAGAFATGATPPVAAIARPTAGS
jgi:exosortase